MIHEIKASDKEDKQNIVIFSDGLSDKCFKILLQSSFQIFLIKLNHLLEILLSNYLLILDINV